MPAVMAGASDDRMRPPDGEPDTGEGGRRQAEHARPEDWRDQVTADDQDRGRHEDRQDEGRDRDPGQHPGATVERPPAS